MIHNTVGVVLATPQTQAAVQAEHGYQPDRAYLLAQLKIATTQYERARLEQRLWEGTTIEERNTVPNHSKRNWLSQLLGMTTSDVELRSTLYLAGAASKPLWARVDAVPPTLTLRVAVRLLRDAKYIVQQKGVTLAHAIQLSLTRHDAAPKRLVTTKDGGVMEARAWMDRDNLRRPAGSGRAPAPRKHTPLADSKRFWSSLREQIADHLRGMMPEGTDEIVVDRLIAEFARDLMGVTDTWQNKLKRLSATETSTAVIRRAGVISACRMLSMDPPKPGKPVDLTVANSRKKALARAYHPDAGGSEATRQQYQDVLEAYANLESYNEGLGAKRR